MTFGRRCLGAVHLGARRLGAVHLGAGRVGAVLLKIDTVEVEVGLMKKS